MLSRAQHRPRTIRQGTVVQAVGARPDDAHPRPGTPVAPGAGAARSHWEDADEPPAWVRGGQLVRLIAIVGDLTVLTYVLPKSLTYMLPTAALLHFQVKEPELLTRVEPSALYVEAPAFLK